MTTRFNVNELPFFSVIIAPLALGAQAATSSLFPGNNRVADLAFAIIILLLVEWTLHRRIKSHLSSVDKILARMVVTSESLDSQHRADKNAIEAVNTRVRTTEVRLESLTARVVHCETTLGIPPPPL